MVSTPAWTKEVAIGIQQSSRQYKAFFAEPCSQIWSEEVKRIKRQRPDFSKLREVYRARPLDRQVADRVIALWHHVLSDRRNYMRDEAIYLDGGTVAFTVRGSGPGRQLAAHTHRWDQGSKAMELVNLAYALKSYVTADISQKQLIELVRAAERVTGLRSKPPSTEASNQAMQLTASKPDVHAWSVCRRNRMLRRMHRGLAAADLVSR
jgi:hypothetical protein